MSVNTHKEEVEIVCMHAMLNSYQIEIRAQK
jgi:hypothetical protein